MLLKESSNSMDECVKIMSLAEYPNTKNKKNCIIPFFIYYFTQLNETGVFSTDVRDFVVSTS